MYSQRLSLYIPVAEYKIAIHHFTKCRVRLLIMTKPSSKDTIDYVIDAHSLHARHGWASP